jgi:DNA-binding NarL/FixJ family response regulator
VLEADCMNCQLIQASLSEKRKRLVVIGAISDPQKTISLMREHDPDVAVVRARLPGGPLDGFVFLRRVPSLKLRTRTILLLDSPDAELIVDVFCFGAGGVVFRNDALETLVYSCGLQGTDLGQQPSARIPFICSH